MVIVQAGEKISLQVPGASLNVVPGEVLAHPPINPGDGEEGDAATVVQKVTEQTITKARLVKMDRMGRRPSCKEKRTAAAPVYARQTGKFQPDEGELPIGATFVSKPYSQYDMLLACKLVLQMRNPSLLDEGRLIL